MTQLNHELEPADKDHSTRLPTIQQKYNLTGKFLSSLKAGNFMKNNVAQKGFTALWTIFSSFCKSQTVLKNKAQFLKRGGGFPGALCAKRKKNLSILYSFMYLNLSSLPTLCPWSGHECIRNCHLLLCDEFGLVVQGFPAFSTQGLMY